MERDNIVAGTRKISVIPNKHIIRERVYLVGIRTKAKRYKVHEAQSAWNTPKRGRTQRRLKEIAGPQWLCQGAVEFCNIILWQCETFNYRELGLGIKRQKEGKSNIITP